MVASLPCCARAPNGHTATAPPSAASNSRRPMVTVIRPSRARCVKAKIPRHERAVFTFKEAGGRMLVASPLVVGLNQLLRRRQPAGVSTAPLLTGLQD